MFYRLFFTLSPLPRGIKRKKRDQFSPVENILPGAILYDASVPPGLIRRHLTARGAQPEKVTTVIMMNFHFRRQITSSACQARCLRSASWRRRRRSGRRIGAWKGNPPAQVASVSCGKRTHQLQALNFTCMFSGGTQPIRKPGTRHFENEEQCKTHRGDPTLSQAAVFPVQNKVPVNVIFNQRYVVLIEQRHQLAFFCGVKVNPSGFWLLVISHTLSPDTPATPVPAPEDLSLLNIRRHR